MSDHRIWRFLGITLILVLSSPALAGKGGNGKGNGPAPKVDICHRDTATGMFKVINVSSNALPAHLGHGDHMPAAFWVDADGDGFGAAGSTMDTCQQPGYVANSGDCDDANNAIKPGAADMVCDGVDDNCDGTIDDQYLVTTTSCGVGECSRTGSKTCVVGQEVDSCAPGQPRAEICDGIDNNCNGPTDDGVADISCYTGGAGTQNVGLCQAGTKTCAGGQWVVSTPEVAPAAESCDTPDDEDCDGTADEDCGPTLTCDCTKYDACLYKADGSHYKGYQLPAAGAGQRKEIQIYQYSWAKFKRLEICSGHFGGLELVTLSLKQDFEIQGAGVGKTILSDSGTSCPPAVASRYGYDSGSTIKIHGGASTSINGITFKYNCSGSPVLYASGTKGLHLSDIEILDTYMGTYNSSWGAITLKGDRGPIVMERVKVDNVMPIMSSNWGPYYYQSNAVGMLNMTTGNTSITVKDSHFTNTSYRAFYPRGPVTAKVNFSNVTFSGNPIGDWMSLPPLTSPYTGTCQVTQGVNGSCTP